MEKKIASVKELSRSDGDVIRITKIERLKLWIIKRVKEPLLKNINSKSWSCSITIISSNAAREWIKLNSKFH